MIKIFFQDLSLSIGQDLKLDPDKVLPILLDLQARAISKLKERDNFIATGIADLRVKISGDNSQILNMKISLSSSSEDLQNLVASKLGLIPSR